MANPKDAPDPRPAAPLAYRATVRIVRRIFRGRASPGLVAMADRVETWLVSPGGSARISEAESEALEAEGVEVIEEEAGR
jgi:hypothetical protein